MSFDIAALLAAMRANPSNVEEQSSETKDLLASALSSMMNMGALPEMEDDDAVIIDHSLAEPEKQRSQRRRAREKQRRLDEICVLDFETDPFDNTRPHDVVLPFLCVIHGGEQFSPIEIWDDDYEALMFKVMNAIEALPGRQTIYAHNGGRFDYKFLLPYLRGEIKFKGNSIMKATIGNHELRDSLHILPTALASLQKDAFDYKKMHRSVRHKHRKEIIGYCVNDCKYALEFIRFFVEKHGFKISIGQAAFAQIKRLYPTIENLSKGMDNVFRQFFFGGRVECFEGVTHYKGPLKYIDLNSAYPAVMAHIKHPIGKTWIEDTEITKDTFFVELSCNSKGALILREKDKDGAMKTRAPYGYHHFYTTIHEYKVALELGLITNITIHKTYNCPHSTNFAAFVIPRYDGRKIITSRMKTLQEGTSEWAHDNKNQTVIKFELNNGYGKFAQNPERYKETMQLDFGEKPEGDNWEIIHVGDGYNTWERPNPDVRYNNVATGASITGAQRAVLLRAIHSVTRPLYCDTDSIICEDTGSLELDDAKLGAWKIEAELDELYINGKKHYAYHTTKKDKWTVRCKGASGVTLEQIISVNEGQKEIVVQKGVTLRNDGSQYYTSRTVRQTALSERIRADGEYTIRQGAAPLDAPFS